jgi:hypothetical protein
MVFGMEQSYLKSILSYDPETGVFRWITPRSGINVGDRAGSINGDGYRVIMIDKKNYPVGRLAFLYMCGYLPAYDVDHWNRDRSDDRWENLREATRGQNMMNGNLRTDNISGHRGVNVHGPTGKWRAYITANGKRRHLGLFSSFDLAVEARLTAEAKYHGEFGGSQ